MEQAHPRRPNRRQAARLLAGLSQDELAAHLGRGDKSLISRWERGFYDLTNEEVERIARALGVHPADLALDDQAVPAVAVAR